jgi:hypothetical protein
MKVHYNQEEFEIEDEVFQVLYLLFLAEVKGKIEIKKGNSRSSTIKQLPFVELLNALLPYESRESVRAIMNSIINQYKVEKDFLNTLG